jgi:hypothetical protein
MRFIQIHVLLKHPVRESRRPRNPTVFDKAKENANEGDAGTTTQKVTAAHSPQPSLDGKTLRSRAKAFMTLIHGA